MSQNYNLIKTGVIDFNNVLIEKYAFIGLNELEVITLVKLQNLLKQPSQDNLEILNVNRLPEIMEETMSIDSSVISNTIARLIEEKYIDLVESNGSIIFSLDPVYKRIANIIDNDSIVDEDNQNIILVKNIVGIIEKEFGVLLSSIELEIVRSWVFEKKYSYDEINQAIIDCLHRKRKSVKFVNDVLKARKISKMNAINNLDNDDTLELFNDIYGKKNNK